MKDKENLSSTNSSLIYTFFLILGICLSLAIFSNATLGVIGIVVTIIASLYLKSGHDIRYDHENIYVKKYWENDYKTIRIAEIKSIKRQVVNRQESDIILGTRVVKRRGTTGVILLKDGQRYSFLISSHFSKLDDLLSHLKRTR